MLAAMRRASSQRKDICWPHRPTLLSARECLSESQGNFASGPIVARLRMATQPIENYVYKLTCDRILRRTDEFRDPECVGHPTTYAEQATNGVVPGGAEHSANRSLPDLNPTYGGTSWASAEIGDDKAAPIRNAAIFILEEPYCMSF